MEVNEKDVALVAPCLAQAKPTQAFGQSQWRGHIWSTKAPENAAASPVLTPPHPTSRTGAIPTAMGTIPQASVQGHEPQHTHKPPELPRT